jgi:hypothetical protein
MLFEFSGSETISKKLLVLVIVWLSVLIRPTVYLLLVHVSVKAGPLTRLSVQLEEV